MITGNDGEAFISILPDDSEFEAKLLTGVKEGAEKAAKAFEDDFDISDAAKHAGEEIKGALISGVKAAALVGGTLLAGGAAGFALGDAFDEMADTIAIGTGKAGEALGDLEGIAVHISTEIPASLDEIGAAVTALTQRTDATGEALENLAKQEIELARLTGADLNSQIANTTRLFADFSVAASEQGAVLDTLFRAYQQTGVGVDALSSLLVRFGVPLRSLGFDITESTALLAGFEREGVNTQLVLSAMRIGLGRFAKAGEDAPAALARLITTIEQAGSRSEATAIAVEALGARAGPDFAGAVVEGRLEFDKLVESLTKGESTILGTAEATNDAGESLKIIGHQLAEAFKPVADIIFGGVSKALGLVVDILDLLGPVGIRVVGVLTLLVAGFLAWEVAMRLKVLVTIGRLIFGLKGYVIQMVLSRVASIAAAAASEGLAVALGASAAAMGAALLAAAPYIAAVVAVTAVVWAWHEAQDAAKESMNDSVELINSLAIGVQKGTVDMDRFNRTVDAQIATLDLSTQAGRDARDAILDYKQAVEDGTVVVREGEEADAMAAAAQAGLNDTIDDGTNANNLHTLSLKKVRQAHQEAAAAAREQRNAELSLATGLLGLSGSAASARDAQQSLGAARNTVSRLEARGRQGTVKYREAVEALHQAQADAIGGQLGLAGAVAEYINEQKTGGSTQVNAIKLITEYGLKAGLTADEIDDLIGTVTGLVEEYDTLPASKTTRAHFEDDIARRKLQKWISDLNHKVPKTVDTMATVNGVPAAPGVFVPPSQPVVPLSQAAGHIQIATNAADESFAINPEGGIQIGGKDFKPGDIVSSEATPKARRRQAPIVVNLNGRPIYQEEHDRKTLLGDF